MASIEEMYADLAQADAQGDYELAQVIASRIKTVSAQKPGTQIVQDAYRKAWQRQPDESRAGMAVRQGMTQVGRGAYDLGVGAGQLGVDLLNLIPGVDIDRSGLDRMAEQSEQAGKYLSDQPAGIVGPLAGGVAATLPLAGIQAPAMVQRAAQSAPMATRLATGTAVGAAYGSASPVTQSRSRVENTATGAAAGLAAAGVGEVLGRALKPVSGAVDPNRARMVRQAEQLGMRLTPGQRTGSVPLQQFEASLASNPVTSGPMARVGEANQKAINRAVASSFGESTDVITEEVIDRAANRIGKTFEQTTKGIRVPLDDTFKVKLGQVLNEYRASLPSLRNPKIEALVTDIEQTLMTQGNTSKLKGEVYQKIVSDLSRISRAAGKGENADKEYARALLSVKEVMDDAAARVMPTDRQAAFREARKQYRNLVTAVNSGAIKGENIAGRTLKTAMSRRDRMGMARGRDQSEMARAARAAEYFQPIVGDSGTATRMSMPAIAGGLSGAGLLGNAAGGPVGAVAAPLAMMGAANLGARAYLSPTAQRYLSGSLIDEISRGSITQAGGILGLLANQ